MDRITALLTLGATEQDSPAVLREAYGREKARLEALAAQNPSGAMQAKISEAQARLETAWTSLQAAPTENPPAAAPARAPGVRSGRKWLLVAAAIVALGGFLWQQQVQAVRRQEEARAQEVRQREAVAAEVARLREALDQALEAARGQLSQLQPLREEGATIKAEAAQAGENAATTAAEKSWRAERWKYFEAFLARIDAANGGVDPEVSATQIEGWLQENDTAHATPALDRLRAFKAPDAGSIATWRKETYLDPLAAFSATQADYVGLLAVAEPSLAGEVMSALRKAALAAVDGNAPTLQELTPVFVLSNLVPPRDETLTKLRDALPGLELVENLSAETLPLVEKITAADAHDKSAEVLQLAAAIREHGARARPALQRMEGAALVALASKAVRETGREDEAARKQQVAGEKLLTAAALAGDEEAIARLGLLLYETNRRDEAVPWLEKTVAAGDLRARDRLFDALFYSLDGRLRARAYPLVEEAVKADPQNGERLEQKATLIELGLGVKGDPARALALYREAVKLGNELAVVDVFRCQLQGIGTPADPEEAFRYAEQAVSSEPMLQDSICKSILGWANQAPEVSEGVARLRIKLHLALAKTRPYPFGDIALENATAYARGTSVEQHRLAAEYFNRLDQVGVGGGAFFAKVLLTEHDCKNCRGRGRIEGSRTCDECGGSGKIGCGECGGTGRVSELITPRCSTCGGSGVRYLRDAPYQVRCNQCNGTGLLPSQTVEQRCDRCRGRGKLTCDHCGGRGEISSEQSCSECEGTGHWRWVDRDGTIPAFNAKS